MDNVKPGRLVSPVMLAAPVVLALVLLATAAVAASEAGGKVRASDVGEQLSRTYETIKAYGYTKRQELAEWADRRAAALDAKIAQLERDIERRGEQMKRETRESYEQAVAMLKEQRDELAVKAGELRSSTVSAWTGAKWELLAAMDRIESAYDHVVDEFSGDETRSGGKEKTQ